MKEERRNKEREDAGEPVWLVADAGERRQNVTMEARVEAGNTSVGSGSRQLRKCVEAKT